MGPAESDSDPMTRTTRHTTTIQTWPGGTSYEYRGDLDGPINQRSLRGGHDTQNLWRKGDPAEWRQIRIATRAELYGAREILTCDSSLVGDLLQVANEGSLSRSTNARDLGKAFEYDRIENLYVDPSEWTAAQCREYLRDQGVEPDTSRPHVPGCPRAVVSAAECLCNLDRTALVTADAADDLEALREACREHTQENPAEVFEWWRVSEWLCKELRAIGEVVIDNDYGCWWGRCTTGQGWIMDGVLQRVAARHETEDR